jgi:hypothetical protein
MLSIVAAGCVQAEGRPIAGTFFLPSSEEAVCVASAMGNLQEALDRAGEMYGGSLVVAGGAAASIGLPDALRFEFTDFDIFPLKFPSPVHAVCAFVEVISILVREGGKVLHEWSVSTRAFTVHFACDDKPIQFILRAGINVAEVIESFDFQLCKFAVVKGRVYTTAHVSGGECVGLAVVATSQTSGMYPISYHQGWGSQVLLVYNIMLAELILGLVTLLLSPALLFRYLPYYPTPLLRLHLSFTWLRVSDARVWCCCDAASFAPAAPATVPATRPS